MRGEWLLKTFRRIALGWSPESTVACSNCFEDMGLRLEAMMLGRTDQSACPRCRDAFGKKPTKNDVEELQNEFFSLATAPHKSNMRLVALRIEQDTADQVEKLRPETWRDWHLIQQLVGGNLGYSAPRLFYFGVTNHLDGPNGSLTKEMISDEILPRLRSRALGNTDVFFRIRLNIDQSKRFDLVQFDSPPLRRRGFGRFDYSNAPVLYGSPSLKVCVHECRVTFGDDVYVATIRPTRQLNLIDFTGNFDQPQDVDPFDDLSWFFNGLLASSDSRAYRHCRRIVKMLRDETGADGIIYNSFFTRVMGDDDQSPAINYALFGRPIAEGKIEVLSMNTLQLNTIKYDFNLGPIFD